MEKEFSFNETINYPLKTVWNALQIPDEIVMDKNAVYDKKSKIEWIEHTSEIIDNVYLVKKIENNQIYIEVENSKYKTEKNSIELKIVANTNTTTLKVTYMIATKALFNIISLELLGKNIAHHISNVIVKNLNKKCESIKED
ncbi:MAG: hypothetical protein RSC93_12035 [Erysipelotrichaceae bacterium]